jgi:hypothetical protein
MTEDNPAIAAVALTRSARKPTSSQYIHLGSRISSHVPSTQLEYPEISRAQLVLSARPHLHVPPVRDNIAGYVSVVSTVRVSM